MSKIGHGEQVAYAPFVPDGPSMVDESNMDLFFDIGLDNDEPWGDCNGNDENESATIESSPSSRFFGAGPPELKSKTPSKASRDE